MIISITAEITPSGSLLVHLSAQVLNLSCIKALESSLTRNTLIARTRLAVYIAPGASRVYFCGHGAISFRDLRYRNNTWRQHVAQWLQCRGIEAPDIDSDTQWVLLVPCFALEKSGPNTAFSWPANLCFLEQARCGMFDVDFLPATTAISGSSGNNDDDLFGFVTSWVASRDEREIRKAKRAAARDWTGTDFAHISGCEEPARSKSMSSPAHQGTTADLHNVTGIYPTPPDGLLAAISNTGGQSESMSGAPEVFAESTSTSPAVRDFADGAIRRPEMVESGCEGQEGDMNSIEDDLFGNDDDMLDDVGVTEADFRFFDADVEDFGQKPSREAVSSPLVETKHHPALFPESLSAIEDEALAGQLEIVDSSPSIHPKYLRRHPSGNGKLSPDLIVSPIASAILETSIKPPCRSTREQRLLLQTLKVADNTDLWDEESAIGNDYLRPLRFNNVLSTADARYVSGGRFDAIPRTKGTLRSQSEISKVQMKHNTIPLVGRPFRVDHKSSRVYKTDIHETTYENWDNNITGPVSEDTGRSESDAASSTSDTEIAHDENPSPAKRRRLYYGVHEQSHDLQRDSPAAALVLDSDTELRTRSILQYLKEIGHISRNSTNKFNDDACETTDTCGTANGSDPVDYIAIAQLVAGQLAAASHISRDEPLAISDCSKPQSVMSAMLGSGTNLDLHTLMQLRGCSNNVEMTRTKVFPKPNPKRPIHVTTEKDPGVSDSYYLLPAPRVRVTRADAGLELLPTALPFWDTLGLGPMCGPKDLKAMCIFPEHASTAISDYAREFLSIMHSAYSQCKLGSHVAAETEHGALIAVSKHGSLVDTCRDLGMLLPAFVYDGC